MQTTNDLKPLSDRDLHRLNLWKALYATSEYMGVTTEDYQRFLKRAEFARYLVARGIVSEREGVK
jgi:CBS-domain-containing membrane protein